MNKRKSSLSMNLSKFKIKKLPYHGNAPNLIDKFLIIGFDYALIEKIGPKIIETNQLNTINNNQSYTTVQSPEKPTVINEIANDCEKELIDSDIIIELIFPSLPTLYYCKNNNQRVNLGNYTTIFSIGPAVNELNTKKSYNCFAYIFYEFDKTGLAFPKAFCFLSEYPYFSSFYNLSLRILNMFKNDMLSVPLEVWLYNFITFMPAPFHKNLEVFITKMMVNPIEEKEKRKKTTQELKSKGGRNLIMPNPLKLDVAEFPMLSGYPLFNFNLPIIFSILPIEIIIEVFFFTFLENDIIFYSENLEILNFTMYVFANLNYPCNDSIYFWHILSISMHSFMRGSSSFASKTCSTMLGINDSYDPKIKTTSKIKEHFIVDIDQKEFLYVTSQNTKTVQNNKELHEYLDKIMSKPNYDPKDSELTRIIKTLYRHLDNCFKKYISANQNEQLNVNVSSKIYKYDKETAIQNRNIQLIFYTFILQVFSLYYKNFSLIQETNDVDKSYMSSSSFSSLNKSIRSTTTSKQGYVIEFNNQQLINSEFDKIFNEKFRESSKFGNFLINFLLYYDTIDFFKIPLLFTEEFMNRITYKDSQKDSEHSAKFFKKKIENKQTSIEDPIISDCFDTIDRFYSMNKEEEILKISDPNYKSKIQLYYLNFNEFYDFYEKELKSILVREQYDSKSMEVRLMPATKKTFLAYKKLELDNKFLLKYIYLLNNLSEEKFNKIFPINKLLKENEIEEFSQSSVNDVVEQYLILQKDFQKHDFIIFIICTLFAATRGFCPNEEAVNELKVLINICNSSNQNLRKYIIKILYIYLKLVVKAQNEKNKENLEAYSDCLNELKKIILSEGNILPNEEFMALINLEIADSKQEGEQLRKSDLDKKAKILTPIFDYNNLEGELKSKREKDLIKSIWTFSSNLDIEKIILQPDTDSISINKKKDNRKDKDNNINNDNDEGAGKINNQPPIKVTCSVEGVENSTTIINFFSVRKLFNESNRLYSSYFEHVDNKSINLGTLEELLWNTIYYMYLGYEVKSDEFDYKIFIDIQTVFINLFLRVRSKRIEEASKI